MTLAATQKVNTSGTEIIIFIILLNFNILSGSIYGQTIITAVLSGTSRAVPLVGFNSNALTMPSVNNLSFVDSLKKLEVPVFRYPGGTNSQYWDWQNGTSLPPSSWVNNGGTLHNYAYLGTTPMVPLPLSEFKKLTDSLGAKPLFVLNVLTRNINDQMNMLRMAENTGLDIDLIELGNEMYFPETDFVNRFPTAGAYAREMNIWTDSIKAQFPNARVAVIGTTEKPTMPNGNPMPVRIRYWNDSIFTYYSYSDAITLHNYFPHNNTVPVPNPVQVLSSAFSEWETSKMYSIDSINNGMQIWFTEYNMNDVTTNYKVATTWLHALYTSAIHLQMLESPEISMILNHQITGAAPFASLASYTGFGDTISNRLTAEGNAMRLLHKAYKDMSFADKLSFSNNPNISYNSFVYPSLVAWTFYNNNKKNIIILNVSDVPYIFNASTLSNNSFDYETISSSYITDTNITTTDLIISKGISASINIAPYSLSLLEENTTINNNNLHIEKDIFNFYPNPAHTSITLEITEHIQPANIKLINTQGKIIMSKVLSKNSEVFDIENLPAGIYYIQVYNNTLLWLKKLIKY